MTRDKTLTDPVALLKSLDADQIRTRIEQLDCERKALLVLLRSAVRKQPIWTKSAPKKGTPQREEGHP
jgi:hypothetical protein